MQYDLKTLHEMRQAKECPYCGGEVDFDPVNVYNYGEIDTEDGECMECGAEFTLRYRRVLTSGYMQTLKGKGFEVVV